MKDCSIYDVVTYENTSIFKEVLLERERQNTLHPEDMGVKSLAILAEEFGEVGKAIFEEKPDDLREELVHVAAVAVRWLEELDNSNKV
jgi:NTP pyrophosphatase (non-canonical NTP hydrolase)